MGVIADTFGQIINDLQNATGAGAARFGRVSGHVSTFGPRGMWTDEKTGRRYGPERGGIGAALLLTMSREDFAAATRRVRAYERIPYLTGTFALNKVGHYIIGHDGPVNRAFDTESAPGGEPWQELSDSEKRWRAHGGGGMVEGPILDDATDQNPSEKLKMIAMSESQMLQVNVTGQYARLLVSPEHLEGKARFKFFVHQLGSDNGWGMGIEIPARPFFPESPDDLNSAEVATITHLITEGIDEGVEERAAERGLRLARGLRG